MENSNEMMQQLAEIIANDQRHRDYAEVVENAELYRKLLTGKDMDSLMRKFDKREDDSLFEQRKRITQHITKTVSQNVIDVYKKIPRSNSVQRFIGYTDNDSEKLRELNNKLDTFWGGKSVDNYMNTRWIDLNFLDPNTFIVLEWNKFDNRVERAQPYPFEISSKDAIMFEYKNNILQYVVALSKRLSSVYKDGLYRNVTQDVYTMYGINQTISFVEIIDESTKTTVRNIFNKSESLIALDTYARKGIYNNDDLFEIIQYEPHNLGYVPAMRVGVISDLATNGRTYVSPLEKGVPVLMKMVKANSEFDLTMALHAFPQKLQYMTRCAEIDCRDGHLLDGSVCGGCHGTGYNVTTSAQEVITLALPKNREDMVDLSSLVKYVYPPTDLVKFQKDYIDSLTYQVKESIFNTEIFSKQQVAETATGKNISLQNVYDALYPVALGYSTEWKFIVDTIASITQLNSNLIAFYKFSKDFKLKSLTDLYLDLKAVGDARASEFIKSSIEDDIASVIYSESERDLLKYNIRKSWFPFSGKSPEQIQTIIASPNLVPYKTRVFWANFSYIFDIIELEQAMINVDFYNLKRDLQKAIIDEKVMQLITDIEKYTIKEPVITF